MKAARLAIAVAVAVLAAGPALLAEPPSPESAASSDLHQQRDRLLEQLRSRRLLSPSASGGPSLPSAWLAPSGSGSALPNAGSLRAELKRKWRLLAESRHERRERHRAALVRELGQRLSDPQIKAELKLHATRVAELSRLRFLTENGRSGVARQKLLERIEKLSAIEAQRHRKQLAKLVGTQAGPNASGAASAPHALPAASAPRGGGRP